MTIEHKIKVARLSHALGTTRREMRDVIGCLADISIMVDEGERDEALEAIKTLRDGLDEFLSSTRELL